LWSFISIVDDYIKFRSEEVSFLRAGEELFS